MHLSNEVPRALRQAIGRDEPFTGRFDLPLEEGEVYLGRTSPVIGNSPPLPRTPSLRRIARKMQQNHFSSSFCNSWIWIWFCHEPGKPLPLKVPHDILLAESA